METKEVQNMDRYEYCYQLIEDIGETADEIEKVFRLSRKEALESAIELVCQNSGRDEAPLMKLIKEGVTPWTISS